MQTWHRAQLIEPSSQPQELAQRLKRLIALSRLALFWERIWPGLWLAFSVVGVFICLSLLNVWAFVPRYVHLFSFLFFALLFGVLLVRMVAKFEEPTRAQAIRRLETKSGLSHRPLSALEDWPANQNTSFDESAQTLWRAHHDWLNAQLKSLRVFMPSPRLMDHDPYGLRVLLGFFLVISLIVAGNAWQERLTYAFDVELQRGSALTHIDAWATPPAYTGKPPLFLTRQKEDKKFARGEAEIVLPEGSVLSVRVEGNGGPPHLDDGDEKIVFKKSGENIFELKTEIKSAKTVTIGRGWKTLAAWNFNIIPDIKPKIAFEEEITITAHNSLRLAYSVKDDYGVVDVRLHLQRAAKEKAGGLLSDDNAPRDYPLTLSSTALKAGKEIAFADLSSHPWGGMKVNVQLIARDARNQLARSSLRRIVLPLRKFQNPLARAVIEQRQKLAENFKNAGHVARVLDVLTQKPEGFIDDVVVYLGLRAAFWRLHHAQNNSQLKGIHDLLWNVAVRLEDGASGDTANELRALQEELRKALAEKASPEKIAQIIEALREAMSRHLAQLARNGQITPQNSFGQAMVVQSRDLTQLLDMIGELAASGAAKEAAALLTRLQEILENVQAPRSGPPSRQEIAAGEALEAMSELIGNERKLLDDTYRIDQRGRPVQSPQNAPFIFERLNQEMGRDTPRQGQPSANAAQLKPLAGRQNTISQQLSKMMDDLKTLGPLPKTFSQAQSAMKEAENALRSGDSEKAMRFEAQALQHLRAGAQTAARQMLDAMQAQAGPGGGGDPLGRPLNGMGGEDVKVPNKSDLQRAREILDELRARAGETGRPVHELEYIERLLKRF